MKTGISVCDLTKALQMESVDLSWTYIPGAWGACHCSLGHMTCSRVIAQQEPRFWGYFSTVISQFLKVEQLLLPRSSSSQHLDSVTFQRRSYMGIHDWEGQFVFVCQAKLEILRHRKMFSPKPPKNVGLMFLPKSHLFFFFFFSSVLHMLGRCSTTELYPQPLTRILKFLLHNDL